MVKEKVNNEKKKSKTKDILKTVGIAVGCAAAGAAGAFVFKHYYHKNIMYRMAMLDIDYAEAVASLKDPEGGIKMIMAWLGRDKKWYWQAYESNIAVQLPNYTITSDDAEEVIEAGLKALGKLEEVKYVD